MQAYQPTATSHQETMSDNHLSACSFTDLPISDALQRGIAEAGFQHCTPIQAQTLPLTLAGTDVAGQAQTGTGKTAAFLIAVIDRLLRIPARPERRTNQPRALILAPTRELAIQIHRDACDLAAHTDLVLGLAYGGTDYQRQRDIIRAGVDILIGTPGRLIDYYKKHVYDLHSIEAVVLDEADRMFDLGFIKDIRFLLGRMPPPQTRLSQLFSATLSLRVNELAYEHMNNPRLVEIEPVAETSARIEESLYYPAEEEKIPLLLGLLGRETPERGLIFVNTKGAADRVWRYLEGNGLPAALLSGDVPQHKRQSLLARFMQGDFRLLVATDVAARGLHVPELSHVFNYDLPQDAEDYVHRIGRTGRAGSSGRALSFACERYALSLIDIEAYIGRKIPVENITGAHLATPQPPLKQAPRKTRDHHRPPRRHGDRHG